MLAGIAWPERRGREPVREMRLLSERSNREVESRGEYLRGNSCARGGTGGASVLLAASCSFIDKKAQTVDAYRGHARALVTAANVQDAVPKTSAPCNARTALAHAATRTPPPPPQR